MIGLADIAIRAAVGALIVGLTGLAGDRIRPHIGSLLAAVPTTTGVSYFFIARDQGTSFAAQAAASGAIAQASNLVFVSVWSLLAVRAFPRRPWWVAGVGVGSYAVLVTGYIARDAPARIAVNLSVYAVLLGGALLLRARLLALPPQEATQDRPPLRRGLLYRMALGAVTVVVATTLAAALGPKWGGIFSSFPATFMSLLLVAYFQRSLPYFLEQALGVIPNTACLLSYIVAVHFLYPRLGIAWGTLASYFVFLLVAWPVTRWSLASLRRHPQGLDPQAELEAATREPQ